MSEPLIKPKVAADVFIGAKIPDETPDVFIGGNAPDAVVGEAKDELLLFQRIQELEKSLAEMKLQKVNLVPGPPPPKKREPLDFNKLSEQDIFDLNIPIEVIDHDMPDYVKVELKDKSYVARWVNKNPRRLGPMKARGWDYVVPEDLATKLKIDLSVDENGQFRFDDVILMKCEKMRYFGMLRANHERALLQVNPKEHHKVEKARVQNDLSTTADGAGAYQKYTSEGKLEVYAPGHDGI
jgi:hypothetical protein